MKVEYESMKGDHWIMAVNSEVEKLQNRLNKLGLGAKVTGITIKYEGKKC